MLIRNFSFRVLFSLLIIISAGAFGQQKVDLAKAEQENKGLFSGGYFRGGVGFSKAIHNYGSIYEELNLSPLNFTMECGTRINRSFGAYFGLSGNLLLKSVSVGLSDDLEQWSQIGLHVGGLYYIKGGNSYFAPELGLGIGMIETTLLGDENTMGVSGTLKYGYDRHITGRLFLGVQAFFSYANCWHQEYIDPATGETLTATTLMYGVVLTFKIGK
jgi:hypothetical protein